MKNQFLYINGWVPKENFRDYYDFLQKLKYTPFEETFLSWNKTLGEKLWETWEYFRAPFRERDFADYDAWKIMFEKMFPYLRDDIIIGAGSLGGTFLLKYLTEWNTIPVKIKKTFFLAAALHDSPEEILWNFSFDITKIPEIKNLLGEIFIYHSRDDHIVPFSDSQELFSYFPDATFREFTNKGHFYLESELPEILIDIKA